MKLKVLGCSGGIGGHHHRTTALLIDHDILVDAGTGVTDLMHGELGQIDHVFLTHAHLDHIAALPLLAEATLDIRRTPIVIHALPETIASLQTHIFNGVIWPDFADAAAVGRQAIVYKEIIRGLPVKLGQRTITPLPANHSVPAVGYQLDSGRGSLVFSGDTASNPAIWPIINQIANLRYLLIEAAFPDEEAAIAHVSRHLHPRQLCAELQQMTVKPEVFITHLKPLHSGQIMREINAIAQQANVKILEHNQVLAF